MNIRYQLLPYIYTLFYLAHNTGSTVVRVLGVAHSPLRIKFTTSRHVMGFFPRLYPLKYAMLTLKLLSRCALWPGSFLMIPPLQPQTGSFSLGQQFVRIFGA